VKAKIRLYCPIEQADLIAKVRRESKDLDFIAKPYSIGTEGWVTYMDVQVQGALGDLEQQIAVWANSLDCVYDYLWAILRFNELFTETLGLYNPDRQRLKNGFGCFTMAHLQKLSCGISAHTLFQDAESTRMMTEPTHV
jgi:hypothetical protein